MKRSILLRALLGAAFPLFAIEDAPAAAGAPATDAAAGAASAEGELIAGASAAADGPGNDTSSSAAPASLSGATGAEGAQQGDGATIVSAEKVTLVAPAVGMNAVVDPLPTVSIDVEDHAEARERFAGLKAKLSAFDNDVVTALRAELDAIGTLLLLHTFASSQAGATGTYSPADL
ncbi:hypothetical protein C3Y08_01860 [Burkholderia gladioli]|uniref:hypothetical protein n=1 Tax=Burkholderia gladioli TaxID=28095 RepID=UPI000CDBA552|nr:hypothetical protein [Burkholderia gladioli]POS10217.1 hypothetical protein C3Y08_01860 [Burkholderia gladioli]